MIPHNIKTISVTLILIISANISLIGQIAFEEASTLYDVSHNLYGQTIGGGVSLYDFNQDGLDDLTLGTYLGRYIGFYVNVKNKFELVEPLVDNKENVKQINWVDFDNDGDPDLYVAAYNGVNRLYQNTGDLQLHDITEKSGLPVNIHFGYGACWGDYNRDGWLDLYYASKGESFEPGYNRLFKNNADGTFSEYTEVANAADYGKLPFCAAFIDYNNDMWPDIYIANDKLTLNTLLENTAHGIFFDVSAQTSANARMNAMCVTPGDFNRDGWMDIYVTNTPIGSQCLQNTGTPNQRGFIQYQNIANELGIHFPGGNCWGSNFLDADNDGDLDLYVSSSISHPQEVSSAFFENIDGIHFQAPFIEGFMKDTALSYTNAVGDFNNDGKIDLIVQNNPPENFYLWENRTTNDNHWIKIDLEGTLSNRDGIGVKLESYAGNEYQMFFTTCGSGFLGQNSSFKHIGLGTHSKLDSLIITWPTGHSDKLFNVNPDQIIHVKEGASSDGIIHVDDDVTIIGSGIPTPNLNKLSATIEIYPNPGKNQLFLQTQFHIKDIEIFNIRGEKLETLSELTQGDLSVVNTASFESGVYFLKVEFSLKREAILKWVKI